MNEPDRKRNILKIIIFALLVNAAAWAGSFMGGDPTSPGPGFLIWGTAPLVVSLLMRAATRDWSDLGLNPEFRKNLWWYAISLLAYPCAIAVALLVGGLFSALSFAGISAGEFMQAALPGVVIYLLFALFEEVGWRGYLAPKMYSLGINIWLAHAFVGIVWASWHLPYIREFSFYTTEGMGTFIPRFYLGAFVFSIVYGEIRILTGTFWPAVLMHWVGNTIANPLAAGLVTFAPGREYLGSIGVDGLIMMLFFILLGVAINRWRFKQNVVQKASD